MGKFDDKKPLRSLDKWYFFGIIEAWENKR
jgi:hypothetical protein